MASYRKERVRLGDISIGDEVFIRGQVADSYLGNVRLNGWHEVICVYAYQQTFSRRVRVTVRRRDRQGEVRFVAAFEHEARTLIERKCERGPRTDGRERVRVRELKTGDRLVLKGRWGYKGGQPYKLYGEYTVVYADNYQPYEWHVDLIKPGPMGTPEMVYIEAGGSAFITRVLADAEATLRRRPHVLGGLRRELDLV